MKRTDRCVRRLILSYFTEEIILMTCLNCRLLYVCDVDELRITMLWLIGLVRLTN